MGSPPNLPDFVLFYDGLCGLCDHMVQFTLDRDKKGRIYFAPIQGEKGTAVLMGLGVGAEELQELSTVYFVCRGVLYRRSRAIFRVFTFLSFPWTVLGLFRFFPAFLTDGVYRMVARLRYRWFGRFDQCRIPNEQERGRFLS